MLEILYSQCTVYVAWYKICQSGMSCFWLRDQVQLGMMCLDKWDAWPIHTSSLQCYSQNFTLNQDLDFLTQSFGVDRCCVLIFLRSEIHFYISQGRHQGSPDGSTTWGKVSLPDPFLCAIFFSITNTSFMFTCKKCIGWEDIKVEMLILLLVSWVELFIATIGLQNLATFSFRDASVFR